MLFRCDFEGTTIIIIIWTKRALFSPQSLVLLSDQAATFFYVFRFLFQIDFNEIDYKIRNSK